MSKHRLFIPQPISGGQQLPVDGEQGHYLSRVLRLKKGSEVTLFDGSGNEFPSVVAEVSRKEMLLQAGDPVSRNLESPLSIRLIQGVSRGERMDFTVQKATELGVRRISPVLTDFSVVKLKSDRALRKMHHWQKIAQSACEQCGRNTLPVIDEPVPLNTLLSEPTNTNCRLLLEPSAPTSLRQLSKSEESIDLLIGPEGGISAIELENITAIGFTPVSFGPRVLRTETAAVAAIAVIQAQWGDL